VRRKKLHQEILRERWMVSLSEKDRRWGKGFLRRLKRGRRSWRENGSRTSTFAKLIAPSSIVRSIQFLDMVF
jgi:hypothetical protein